MKLRRDGDGIGNAAAYVYGDSKICVERVDRYCQRRSLVMTKDDR